MYCNMRILYRNQQFRVKHKISPVFNDLRTYYRGVEFIPACAGIVDRFLTAGTSSTDGCAPGPARGLRSSCENCGGEFPLAALPFQTLLCVARACRKNPQRFPSRPNRSTREGPRSEE